MHSIQQNIENDRNNPPIGNIPGPAYMRSTLQYFPASSETRLDVHGHHGYHDFNKLIVPNEYRRPSSAPLTPVEPRKIGRRFRRSNSVEELSPDSLALHDGDPRRDTGLSRYQFPTGVSVRSCAGALSSSDPNRTMSTSHFSAMDSSIMSHTQPISFERRHEYNMSQLKTDRHGTNDLKEINYRPYMDNHHPYSNIKKNLAERFVISDRNPSSTSVTSSTYHPSVSRANENYFTYNQYPPQSHPNNMPQPPSGMSRNPYTAPHETMVTRPHHSEHLPVRANHVDSHSQPGRYNNETTLSKRPALQKEDDDARMQAMNTYFEMLANVQQPGSTPEGLVFRSREVSREVIIQKGNFPSTYNSSNTHPVTNSSHPYPHSHDVQGKIRSTDVQRPHEQNATRYPHDQSAARHLHEQVLAQHPHEQSTVQHPHLSNTTQQHSHPHQNTTVIQQHHLHDKGVPMQRSTPPHAGMQRATPPHAGVQHATPPHAGMESNAAAGGAHNVHGVTHPTQNASWSTVGPPGDIHDIREKDQNLNYFRTAPANSLDCGCTYPKNDMVECKGRNPLFKPGETDHSERSRYIKSEETEHADHSRFINPYEGTQYRRSDKAHPPELINYQEKMHHNVEYAITTPSRPSEMVAPPLLKIETPKPDSASSPSSHKKRPRPEPLVIPSTVNNKALLSTPCSMGRPVMNLQHHSVYTPPPMLSPRSVFFNPPLSIPRVYPPGTGYVVQTPRRVSLISDVKLETPSSAVSIPSADKPVEVPEPKINVGPQFQAVIPNIYEKSEAQKDIHRAGLMWSPLKDEKRKDEEVLQYLEMACSLALYGGSTNKEYALHILQRTRGNVKEAIRLLLSRRHILRADDPNADYHYSGSVRWNAKERLAFRTAYHTKGKVFPLIQKEIGSKSVASCIEFYYLWKARHPESFRMRTRTAVEVESEQDEEEVPPTPTAAVAPLSTLREPVFECDYPSCNARFISRQALNGHIRVHGGSHTKTPDARRPPKEKASNSPKTGQTGSTMDSPPKRKKTSNPGTPAQASDGTPLQFQCKVCGRVFNKVKSRSAHMKTHVKRDENNKPIKTQKTKVQVEIKPIEKPYEHLIHALANDNNNNNPAFEPSKPSPSFDRVMDTTKQPFSFPVENTNPLFSHLVDNTKPAYVLADNTKPSLDVSVGNTNPPQVCAVNTQASLDATVEHINSGSELSSEHTKNTDSGSDNMNAHAHAQTIGEEIASSN